MPDSLHLSTARLGRCLPPALLLAVISALVPSAELRAQTDEEIAESMTIALHNPLTGGELPTQTPYPTLGQLADGVPDKIPFRFTILLNRPVSELGADDTEEILEHTDVELSVLNLAGEEVAVRRQTGPDPGPGYLYFDELDDTEHGNIGWQWGGEIDLPFDILHDMVLQFKAKLYVQEIPIDSMITEIRPGMPELRIRSTITSGNYGGTGLQLRSTVSGTTGLEFLAGYRSLSGIGRLEYEEFHIDMPGCPFNTTTEDGAFEAVEIVLFEDDLPPPVAAPEPGRDLSVTELVLALDPRINESARPDCGFFSIPLPHVHHFFAAFHTFHGGAVEGHDRDQDKEMDEARRGLVIGGWVPGTGPVIGTRTYSRQGSLEDAVLTEETTLEVRWRQ